MTPLLQLRLWWRRGSGAERLASVLATGVIIALAAWVLVPTDSDDDGATTVGAGAGPAGVEGGDDGNLDPEAGEVPLGEDGQPVAGGGGGSGGGSTASGGGGSARDTSGGTSGGSANEAGGQNGAPECLEAPDGTPGVKDDEIFIAVGLLELAGPIGNSAAGQAESGEMQRIAETIIADINARGGVQCRQLVAKFYRGNPINPEQTRATCLEIIQDRPFMVADAGAFAFPQGAYNCLPQQKVPALVTGNLLNSEIQKFAPYLASPSGGAEVAMRDVAFGARDLGLFDPAKGFKKLGLLFDDCSPEYNGYLEASLAKVGMSGDKISKYVFPCPSGGFAPANQMSQAVIQHQRDGVTHVIPLTGGGSFKPYTEIAEGQRFRPKYILTDYQGIIITSASSLRPNENNFGAAVGITTGRLGQDTTPGFQHDPATQRCIDIVRKAGFGPEYATTKGGGGMCNVLTATVAAINGARALTREAVLPGLFNAGPVSFGYPADTTTYEAPAKFHGGDTWWSINYTRECSCWRVPDPTRRPSYPA